MQYRYILNRKKSMIVLCYHGMLSSQSCIAVKSKLRGLFQCVLFLLFFIILIIIIIISIETERHTDLQTLLNYYLLSIFSSNMNCSFVIFRFPSYLINFELVSRMDECTDVRTYGRSDRPSYRDARTHLKIRGWNFMGSKRNTIFSTRLGKNNYDFFLNDKTHLKHFLYKRRRIRR